MSCLGGWLAGNVTVGLVSKAPVTLIPVFSTTGASPEVGALPVGVELVDEAGPMRGSTPQRGNGSPTSRRSAR